MGWGEKREPAPAPVATTGTSRQIEEALAALRAVGVDQPNLALAAIEAAGVIDRLRHGVVLHLASVGGTAGRLADDVARHIHDLLGESSAS